jgi:hypothetical protein
MKQRLDLTVSIICKVTGVLEIHKLFSSQVQYFLRRSTNPTPRTNQPTTPVTTTTQPTTTQSQRDSLIDHVRPQLTLYYATWKGIQIN